MTGSGELVVVPVDVAPRLPTLARRALPAELQRASIPRMYRIPPPHCRMVTYDPRGRAVCDESAGSHIDLYI